MVRIKFYTKHGDTMMTKVKTIFKIAGGMALLSAQALAHPGHDHSDPSSVWIHAMFYGSIAVAVLGLTCLAFFVMRSRRDKGAREHETSHSEEL